MIAAIGSVERCYQLCWVAHRAADHHSQPRFERKSSPRRVYLRRRVAHCSVAKMESIGTSVAIAAKMCLGHPTSSRGLLDVLIGPLGNLLGGLTDATAATEFDALGNPVLL